MDDLVRVSLIRFGLVEALGRLQGTPRVEHPGGCDNTWPTVANGHELKYIFFLRIVFNKASHMISRCGIIVNG